VPLAWQHTARDAADLEAIQRLHLDRLFQRLHYAAMASRATSSPVPTSSPSNENANSVQQHASEQAAMDVSTNSASCQHSQASFDPQAPVSQTAGPAGALAASSPFPAPFPVSFDFTVRVASEQTHAAVQQHLIHQSLHWVPYSAAASVSSTGAETSTQVNVALPVGFSLMTPTVTTATTAIIHPQASGLLQSHLTTVAQSLEAAHNRAHALFVAQIEHHANAYAQVPCWFDAVRHTHITHLCVSPRCTFQLHGAYTTPPAEPRSSVHSATQLTVQLNPMGPSHQQYEHAMRYVLSPVTLRSALIR